MQSRRLELLGLEERITPAVVASFSGNALTLLSDSNDTFSVSSDANGVISITGTTVTAGDANVTVVPGVGNNPSTVTVNSLAGGAAAVQVLALTGDNAVENQDITLININSTAFNTNFGISFNVQGGDDIIRFGGSINLNGTGTLIADASGGVDAIVLGQGSDLNLTSVSGAITIAPAGITSTNIITLSNNVTINSTSGNVTLGDDVVGAGKNLSINSGSGTVTAIRTLGDTTTALGNLTITSTNATSSAISLESVNAGDVILTGTGDVSVSGVVAVTSINTKSTAGDVIFGNTVTTSAVGGFTSEATLATKATQIANLVDVGAGANALVTGNLVSTNAVIITSNVGTITITGNVDASVAGNDLTLTAGSGAITIGGNVGSSAVAMGRLFAEGNTSFSANGTVTVGNLEIGDPTFGAYFATSINFAEAVKVTGADTSLSALAVYAISTGTITFAKTIEVTNATASINVGSVNGSITVTGAITGKKYLDIYTSGSGSITLSGAISTDAANGGIFIQSTTGNVVTSGAISTSGAFDSYIIIDTATSGNVTVNGNVSTSGGGDIFLGADDLSTTSGTGILTINGTVTTTGTAAGDIILGVSNGSVAVNKAVTAGATGDVLFLNNLATDSYTIVSGANISAGDNVVDAFTSGGAAGIINLGANITALNGSGIATLTINGIGLDNSINLIGAVSMKASGTGGDISLASVNGAQNLTLEATDQIHFKNSVGQTLALNTLTVTNSRLVLFDGDLTAANVILTNTATTIFFKGNTTITSSLTTTANAYNLYFDIGKSVVIAGAPVFLNTGYLSLFGTTSLPSGATITGGSLANVNLAGTIVSGGAFNIGAGLSDINISDTTKLILNSTTSGSTFASPISLDLTRAGSFNLLGLGTLTLSANSTAGITTGDTINVINGTLNVTGTLGSASTVTLTNGTLTGPGGTVGNLVPTIGTVDPQGTLQTGAVTFNAATTYIADVLTPTTATNLQGNASFNLGGAILSLSSVAAGLAVGNTFTIINNTAVSGGITGTFAGLPEGSSIFALDALGNTVTFAISYVGGTGANDVTLTVTNVSIANPSAIPQPMVAGQPLFNFFTAVGADAGGGPMVTVTLDILPGLTTVPTYFSFFAYDEGFTGGVRVAVNDLDGNDDTLEIITGAGAGGGPNVRVFQFNILTLTFNPTPIASFFAFNEPSFDGGIYVAGGDVTGDGIGDLLVGAGESGGPRVQVYAGSLNGVITSSPISDFFAYSTAFTGGVVVAAGDRTGDNTLEVITGPASNGGYNIKSFNVAGTGNNPTLIENFFAFNDFTSIGGLSIATAVFDANPLDDLVIGTTNTQFGVILNQDYEGIQANPFPGFTGAIRAGFADSSNSGVYQAVAAAGPGGGPVISAFSVDPINLTLSQTDSLFVLDPEFTGGLFVAN